MAVPPFRCELEARWQATAGQDLMVETSLRKRVFNQPLADNWLTIGSVPTLLGLHSFTRVAFEWIGRNASTALAEFATVVVSVARVIIPTRIEIHGRTTFPM